MTPRRRRLTAWAQSLVMVALLVYLAYQLDLSQTAALFTDLNWQWVIPPILLGLASVWLNAYRWRVLLLGANAAPPPLWRLAYAQIVGQFFNVFLPSDAGGDVYKMYDIYKLNQTAEVAVASVVGVRGLGLLVLGLILAWGLVAAPHYIHQPVIWAAAWAYALLCLGAAALLIDQRLPRRFLASTWMQRDYQNRVARRIFQLIREFLSMFQKRGLVLFSLVLAAVFQLLVVVIVKCYGLAIGVDPPIMGLIVVSPLIALISSAPISINAIGLKEGAFVYFLANLGLTLEQGLAVALLSRVIIGGLIPLIGGLLFLIFRRSI
jgi:hypothetical protein